MDAADDSNYEISILLKSLHAGLSNNRKRSKALQRFRSYLETSNVDTTSDSAGGRQFYDDDIVWLLSGRPPVGSFEPGLGQMTGLIPACGEPSTSGGLKRSAAEAIKLVFYLVFEAVVDEGSPPSPEAAEEGGALSPSMNDNIFLEAFIALPLRDIELMSLSEHLVDEGDGGDASRSGSMTHAFALLLLLLNRRKDGFPSSFEGGLEEGRGEGQLTLEMLLPDSARQQTYLSLLRKFQGEQSPDKSGGEVRDCEAFICQERTKHNV